MIFQAGHKEYLKQTGRRQEPEEEVENKGKKERERSKREKLLEKIGSRRLGWLAACLMLAFENYYSGICMHVNVAVYHQRQAQRD